MPFLVRIITIISSGIVSFFSPLIDGGFGIFLASFFIVLGLVSLIRGGDMLIDGSGQIAKKFGVPPIVIGLTILAFGTSAPELFVNLIASIRGESNLLISNIVGSNISNLLFIGGSAALIALLPVKRNTLLVEIPISIGSALILLFLINDTRRGKQENFLSPIDGSFLLIGFFAFLAYVFSLIKKQEIDIENEEDEETGNIKQSVFFIILGIYALYAGGDLIVHYASILAEMFGVSKIMIGASIVAIGTSVPELVTSVIAARKNHTDMAIGNIVGSNIFNILRIGGICSFVKPIPVNQALNMDILMLVGITLLLFLFVYLGKRKSLLHRHGVILVTLYIAYIAFLVRRG